MAERVQCGLFGRVGSSLVNRCRLVTEPKLADSGMTRQGVADSATVRFFFSIFLSSYFDHNLSYRPPNEVWFEAMETLKSFLQLL